MGFGDFVFSGFDDLITGFSISTNTGFTEEIVEDFSFDAHSLTLAMDNGGMSYGAVLVFDIVSTQSAVPEPSTIFLFGGGLAGLAWYRLKRKQS